MRKQGKTKRVVVALNLARPDGRRKFAGLMRYLAARNVHWDLRVKRGPDEFLPQAVLDLPRWKVDGVIYSLPMRGVDAHRAAVALAALPIPLVVLDPDDASVFAAPEAAGRRFPKVARDARPYQSPKSEVQSPKSEVQSPKSEVQSPKSEVQSPKSNFALIRSDATAIGNAAAGHLSRQGSCRAFGCVRDAMNRPWSVERERAFAAALAAAGLSCTAFTPARLRRDDFRELCAWLRLLPKPAGVFVCCDDRALTVLEACAVEGFRVPEDVSVLSVDDDDFLCSRATPALSSVRPDFERAGYAAGAVLSQLMRERSAANANHALFYSVRDVVERASTQPIVQGAPLVRACLHFIAENAETAPTPDDVAAHFRVSRSLLDLRFRELSDVTVREAIERARLDAVKRRLVETNDTIKEIAAATGFSDAFHLMHLFRRRFGMTMKAFRSLEV